MPGISIPPPVLSAAGLLESNVPLIRLHFEPNPPAVYQCEDAILTDCSFYTGGGFTAVAPGNPSVGNLTGGKIDFGQKYFTGAEVTIRYSGINASYSLYIDGVKVSAVFFESTGSYSFYFVTGTGIFPEPGVHTVFLQGDEEDAGNQLTFDWLSF